MSCERVKRLMASANGSNGLRRNIAPKLREQLEACNAKYSHAALETHIASSEAALGTTDAEPFLDSQTAVRQCSTFQGLSQDAQQALEQELVQRSFPKRSQLLEQGQPARGLHLILQGFVDVIDVDACERIDCNGAGSVLGEMSLLTNQPCSADVVATSDVEALVLPAESYHKLIPMHPELEIAISQLVSDRLGSRRRDAFRGKTLDRYE